jgi:hypothetical protein
MYRMKTERGTFYYDPNEENIFKAITVDAPRPMKRILTTMLMTPNFIDNKGQRRLLPKDKEIFFLEYIPRALKLKGKVEKVED